MKTKTKEIANTFHCSPVYANDVESDFVVFDVYLSSKLTPKMLGHVKQQGHHNCFVEKGARTRRIRNSKMRM